MVAWQALLPLYLEEHGAYGKEVKLLLIGPLKKCNVILEMLRRQVAFSASSSFWFIREPEIDYDRAEAGDKVMVPDFDHDVVGLEVPMRDVQRVQELHRLEEAPEEMPPLHLRNVDPHQVDQLMQAVRVALGDQDRLLVEEEDVLAEGLDD